MAVLRHDNDGELVLILAAAEDGRSVDYVAWKEARDRLVMFLIGDKQTSTTAVYDHAEDLLCVIFTGRTSAP